MTQDFPFPSEWSGTQCGKEILFSAAKAVGENVGCVLYLKKSQNHKFVGCFEFITQSQSFNQQNWDWEVALVTWRWIFKL